MRPRGRPEQTPEQAQTLARELMRRARSAALGTSFSGGHGTGFGGTAYGSLVTVAFDVDGSPLMLFSDLSDHVRNLGADDRASLLFDEASHLPNPQTGPRLTVMGRIAEVSPADTERVKRRFLAKHPGAALYAGFGDFRFYRMTMDRAHWIGGFARAIWFKAAKLVSSKSAARAVMAAEVSVIDHMNSDHADAVSLCATKLLGLRGKRWKVVSVDPFGVDVNCAKTFGRLTFKEPVSDTDGIRKALIDLTRQARKSS